MPHDEILKKQRNVCVWCVYDVCVLNFTVSFITDVMKSEAKCLTQLRPATRTHTDREQHSTACTNSHSHTPRDTHSFKTHTFVLFSDTHRPYSLDYHLSNTCAAVTLIFWSPSDWSCSLWLCLCLCVSVCVFVLQLSIDFLCLDPLLVSALFWWSLSLSVSVSPSLCFASGHPDLSSLRETHGV